MARLRQAEYLKLEDFQRDLMGLILDTPDRKLDTIKTMYQHIFARCLPTHRFGS